MEILLGKRCERGVNGETFKTVDVHKSGISQAARFVENRVK
jgi:hypothetical protein